MDAFTKMILALSLFASPTAFALNVGDEAPCVVLNHLLPGGGEAEHCIREPQQDGQYKLLEFFSAVCSSCARNRPIVHGLYKEIGHAVTFRFVGIDRRESLLREYVSLHRAEIPFEVALDTGREAARAYGIVATPTLFVLDPQDRIVFKNQGVLTLDDLMHIKQIIGTAR